MLRCRLRCGHGLLGLCATLLACGPKLPEGEVGDPSGGTSGGGTSGGTTTAPTTSTGTTGTNTSASETTGSPVGICDGDWEHPASIAVTLKIDVPDADVADEFDPSMVYPNGTAPGCVRWNGEKVAGVQLAFGPVVGDGPQSYLQVEVIEGERTYGTDSWPSEPGAYTGLTAFYTLAGEPSRTWDFVSQEGVGFVDALWVPRRTGEHIVFDAKLMMTHDGSGPQIGFRIDAVVAPAEEPTEAFCAGLDSSFKCDTAGCGGWLPIETVTDLETCALATTEQCHAVLASTGDDAYDSAFYRVVDGTVHMREVGGEACSWHGTEFPAGWSECGVGPNDPPECACVCAAGKCPGDTALALLTGCQLPEPCPVLDVSSGVDENAGDCAFQTVAADAPAALRLIGNAGDPDWDDRVYVRGDGTASWLHGDCDVSCIGSCDDRDWGVPRTCTLREPAFFTGCAAATDPAVLAECFDVSAWFTGCTVAPATCP